MKKSSLIIVVVMLLTSMYAYFFVFMKDQKKMDAYIESKRIAVSEGLDQITIKTAESKFTLEYREQKWWVTEPVLYPAKPDFLERSLTVMNQVLADATFKLKEDRYGFSKSLSQMNLKYANGENKTLVLGGEEGVSSQIYILNKETNLVYVVHNVWGQLFYYKLEDVVSNTLPLKGWEIERVELYKEGKSQWVAEKSGQDWTIQKEAVAIGVKNSELLWWLRSIKDIEPSPIKYNQPRAPNPLFELKVTAQEGDETLSFYNNAEEVYISSLKVFAQVSPYSLKSIEAELEKVFKSAK